MHVETLSPYWRGNRPRGSERRKRDRRRYIGTAFSFVLQVGRRGSGHRVVSASCIWRSRGSSRMLDSGTCAWMTPDSCPLLAVVPSACIFYRLVFCFLQLFFPFCNLQPWINAYPVSSVANPQSLHQPAAASSPTPPSCITTKPAHISRPLYPLLSSPSPSPPTPLSPHLISAGGARLH